MKCYGLVRDSEQTDVMAMSFVLQLAFGTIVCVCVGGWGESFPNSAIGYQMTQFTTHT